MKALKSAFPLFVVVLLGLFGLQSCSKSDKDASQTASVTEASVNAAEVTTFTDPQGRTVKIKDGKVITEQSLEDYIAAQREEGRQEGFGEAKDSIQRLLVTNAYLQGENNGLKQCCGCGGSKTTVVRTGGTGSPDLRSKGGYEIPQGPVYPYNWSGVPAITVSPIFSPVFNNNGWTGGSNGNVTPKDSTGTPPPPPTPLADKTAKRDSVPPSPPVSEKEPRFTPSYGVTVVPGSEAGMVNGGLRWNLTDKFAVDAGLVSGYRRLPQTATELLHGYDVKTGTHTFVGAKVGASYRVANRFSAFGNAAVWGLDDDDFALTFGGAYQIMKNVNLGLGFTASKDMKGVSLIIQN